GFNAVQATDTNGDAWREAIQVSTSGSTVAIPDLPTTGVDNQHGGPIGLTAIGVGRVTGATFSGLFGLNGVRLFVGALGDATRDANGNPQNQAAGLGPQLYVNLIPTNDLPWPPSGINWNNHSWANLNLPTPTNFSAFSIDQVLLDPTNNNTFYVYVRGFDLT